MELNNIYKKLFRVQSCGGLVESVLAVNKVWLDPDTTNQTTENKKLQLWFIQQHFNSYRHLNT